jgi:hypothetical protein
LKTLSRIEGEEYNLEKLPCSKLYFGKTKDNFVKKTRTALRMVLPSFI